MCDNRRRPHVPWKNEVIERSRRISRDRTVLAPSSTARPNASKPRENGLNILSGRTGDNPSPRHVLCAVHKCARVISAETLRGASTLFVCVVRAATNIR